VRPHTLRRPRLALGDGAATRVGFFVQIHTHIYIDAGTHRLEFDALELSADVVDQFVLLVGFPLGRREGLLLGNL